MRFPFLSCVYDSAISCTWAAPRDRQQLFSTGTLFCIIVRAAWTFASPSHSVTAFSELLRLEFRTVCRLKPSRRRQFPLSSAGAAEDVSLQPRSFDSCAWLTCVILSFVIFCRFLDRTTIRKDSFIIITLNVGNIAAREIENATVHNDLTLSM